MSKLYQINPKDNVAIELDSQSEIKLRRVNMSLSMEKLLVKLLKILKKVNGFIHII